MPTPRWGLSPLDVHVHAVEDNAEHPNDIYVALCGQFLFKGVSLLHDEPYGRVCQTCQEKAHDRPAQPEAQNCAGSSPARWARSPLDYCAHLLRPESEHPPGVLLARCGAQLTLAATQHEHPPPGLRCEECDRISRTGSVLLPERGRLYAPGRRTDTNAHHTLMIVQEWDGSWSIHCPDAPGLQLNPDVMICVAESILKRARRGWIEGMR